jgi:hypothetical protein
MTQDPIQPLADAGRRVLRIVRYLATPPVPDQPLESYESLLRDPVVAMSGICNELLERLAPAPVAAEPEDFPHAQVSRSVPDSNASPASPTLSSAGAVAPRSPANGHDEVAYSLRENSAMERPGTPRPGLHGPSTFEWSSRAIHDPTLFQGEPGSPEPAEAAAPEPGGAALRSDSPARPSLRRVINGPDNHPEAGQTTKGAPRSRGMPHPAERLPIDEHPIESDGDPSLAERDSETQPPARQQWLDTRYWRPEIPSDATARTSDVPAQAENGPARGAGEVDPLLPPTGSRLTASTERLAAMLRAHVAQPEPVAGTAGEEVPSSQQGDDEHAAAGTVDEPARARSDNRAGIEEIMERLADELETEFVRTYGSSGG